MAAESTATTTWQGDLASGSGTVSAGSGALSDQAVSWAARTERSGATDPRTSPEELIAAAHSACFSMAFSHALAQAGHAPERLDVTATVTFAPKPEGGFGISTSRLRVRGRVPGIDAGAFQEAARGAGEGCPVSGALRGNVAIDVEAELEG